MPDRGPRLSADSLLRAWVHRAVAIVCFAFFVTSLVVAVAAFATGQEDRFEPERNRNFRGGGFHSDGAALVGFGVAGLVCGIALRFDRTTRIVLRRADRLNRLRSERARKTVRRAAAQVARDYGIPDDVDIRLDVLRRANGTPVVIRLSTATETWELARTEKGWVYLRT